MMANQFPRSKFTGYDISEEAITKAQLQTITHDNKNVEFEVKDISKILNSSFSYLNSQDRTNNLFLLLNIESTNKRSCSYSYRFFVFHVNKI